MNISKELMYEIAKYECIYVTSKVTNISNMQISKEFKLDHSSIGYILRKVEEKLNENSFEERRVNEIIEALKKQS